MKTALLLLSIALVPLAPPLAAKESGDFPRLLGMNIGAKNYHEPDYQAELARYHVLVLDF
jgi:hypothetical protein